MTERRKGKLVVISGPSGVGKGTICKAVVERTGAMLSVSTTSRPKAHSEIDGREYRFISREAFEEGVRDDEFLEYAEVFGNFYGTPRGTVEAALSQGRTVILEIDVQGGRKVKSLYPDVTTIFILPPSPHDLASRMQGRGRGEDAQNARMRLDTATREIAAAWQYYQHMVINADLEHAIREVIDIIQANNGETQ